MEYRTGLVCLNGHVETTWMEIAPPTPYCSICGEPTISACPDCDAPIRGMIEGIVPLADEPAPQFCYNCGKPYPWTGRALEAADELVNDLENLSDEEKELLMKSINELLTETPQTIVAATRFKGLLFKARGKTAAALKELVVEIVAETTKRMLTS